MSVCFDDDPKLFIREIAQPNGLALADPPVILATTHVVKNSELLDISGCAIMLPGRKSSMLVIYTAPSYCKNRWKRWGALPQPFQWVLR